MPTQVVTVTEIDKLNAANVADIAKHFAGVTIKDYGGIGGLKTISVRGLGAAHTGVSYDGLMMSDIQSGQIDLSQFCVENIAAVSLDNGQPMNLLQPARMFASSSVLSLQTKLPTYDSTHTFSGKAAFKTGSFGLVNPSVLLEKYFGKKLGMSLQSNATKATGNYPYSVNINPYGVNMRNGIRNNTDVTSVSTEFNTIYTPALGENLSIKFNHYYNNRGIPGSVTVYNENDNNSRMTDNNFLAQIRYDNKNNNNLQYFVSGKFNSQFMHYVDISNKYSTLQGNKRFEKYQQNEYYLSSGLQYRPIEKLTMAVAVDGWYNDLTTKSNMNYNKDPLPVRKSILANISAKYVSDRFTFGGNLLYTTTHETADSTFAAPDRNKLSPTVFMSWHANPKGNLILRLFYKEIFRLPNFTELYYHDLGYKYLRPENTHQINLGVTYHSSAIPLITHFSFTADAYYNKVSDKIIMLYGMPFSTVRNIGLVEVKGCDLNFHISKDLNKNNSVIINANYSFQLAKDFEKGSDLYGDIIPYTPIHSGSASVSYSYKQFEAGYNILFADKRYSGQNSDVFNYLKPYTDQNIYSSYTWKALRIKAEILNFMNTNYAIVQYYPMPARHFRFSIQYKF